MIYLKIIIKEEEENRVMRFSVPFYIFKL